MPLLLTRNFDKKLASCIPYFTALQVIKRRLISKILNVCKKSIQLLQNYSLICLSRPVDQNVYKIADKSASILTNQILDLSQILLKLNGHRS